jgi:hypothetical protein
MRNIDLGQMIAILANVGVIAGIVFLAIELRQNNRFLSAQAEFNLFQNRSVDSREIYEDPDLAELWTKINNGLELSESDELRIKFWANNVLVNWQWEYGQVLAGNFKEGKTSSIHYSCVLFETVLSVTNERRWPNS